MPLKIPTILMLALAIPSMRPKSAAEPPREMRKAGSIAVAISEPKSDKRLTRPNISTLRENHCVEFIFSPPGYDPKNLCYF
jgi:hypothetical protein